MNLIDLQEKRNKLMHDATALVQGKETVTAEARSAFDKQIAEVDALDADISRLERVAKFESEQRSNASNRPNPAENVSKEVAEKRSMLAFLRNGEKRDLLTTNTGGAVVPQAFLPEIQEAQKAWGGILNIVKTKVTADGAPMKISYDNDTTNLLVPIGEGAPVSEQDPALSSQILSTDELTTGIVKLSMAELNDAAFDLDAWIRQLFGKRVMRGLSKLVTTGSTSGNIASIVTGYAGSVVTTAAAGVVAYKDLVAAYGALDPAYVQNATWTMNATVRALLMGVVDGFGRPLFIPSPNAGAFDTLLGRPVVLNQFQDNEATGKTAVQFGDFESAYLLRKVAGDLSVKRLDERYAELGEVGFIGYARAGGISTNAGIPPIVNIVCL